MTGILRETALYIDGRWVPGGGSDLEVVDPATEQVTGVVTQASTDDVEAAVAAARAAFPAWADDEAVAIANNSIYGLGGAVWGADDEAAMAVAARLRTGQVDVNGAAFNPGAPFGGFKQSGTGREIGEHGIADLCEIKAVQR